MQIDDATLVLRWSLEIAPYSCVARSWTITLHDTAVAVSAPATPAGWRPPVLITADRRLQRWLATALDDLDALRLSLPDHPQDAFVGAGAPWYLTLFGRDSLWAAQFLLPLDTATAGSTLRVLARLQGTTYDAPSAQQPGKILHELRAGAFELPTEALTLPPHYYGTVDATALWVCLLADAWDHGLPDDEVRALLPALDACLEWILERGDADGDGFIDYFDPTGHGLSNQGWKDSGDSIQWRTGELARGPLALCEVQGYAYEAALAGARLREAFQPGRDVGRLRSWAAELKAAFARHYWVSTPEGRYPGIALDADKRAVDTLTSNIGHLIGTGILTSDEERGIAALLTGDSMATGFGLRTMSTEAVGYWPLSYHGGSVWTHDTAIVIRGLTRSGLHAEAAELAEQLLEVADGFDFRVPELHGGEPRNGRRSPTAYPASCRPQAWSAAAAVVVAQALDALPDRTPPSRPPTTRGSGGR